MGQIYKHASNYLIESADSQEVFVEIGSEVGEGSTEYFAKLAAQHNKQLITVDVEFKNFKNLDNTVAVQATGSEWAKQFGNYGKKICCLYLDNFDYDWDVLCAGSYPMIKRIQEQREEYLARGVIMNNLNCQTEHLSQMLSLLPYMADHSVVVCDDTYKFNDCYVGKCGAVIPLLYLHGYQIVEEDATGVILARNIN